jgi:ATP-dependent DNA ligase
MPVPTMLAQAIELDQINAELFSAGPLLVQPKLDGIRVQVHNGVAYSGRNLKLLPNEYIQSWCQAYLTHEHLDGEMTVIDNEGQTLGFANTPSDSGEDRGIESHLMTRLGAPNFVYTVFDELHHPTLRYELRLNLADTCVGFLQSIGQGRRIKRIVSVATNEVDFLEGLMDCYIGPYEGIVLRLASGPYKHGRSTFNERYLLKYKSFVDDEAYVLYMEELIRDDGTRGNTLGALVCRSANFEETFKIGTGFTSAQRDMIWRGGGKYWHQQLTYKYQPHGTKTRPRSPVFLRFRQPE